MRKVFTAAATLLAVTASPLAFAAGPASTPVTATPSPTTAQPPATAQTPIPAQTPVQTTQSAVGTTQLTSSDDVTATPMPAPTTASQNETITIKQTFHPNRPLLFTGGAIFLGSYVTTAALTATKQSANEHGDKTMYLPVIGPWMHLGDIKETGWDLAFTVGSGILQGAGAGLLIASLLIPEKVDAATIQAGDMKMHILPTALGTSSGGLGAVGTF